MPPTCALSSCNKRFSSNFCEPLAITLTHTYLKIMNRRDFLTSLAAASAAPFAAHPALALNTKTVKIPPMLYLYAKHQAERFGPASAAILTRTLGIAPSTAQAISAKLIRAGVTATPIVQHAPKLTNLNLRETTQNLIAKAQELDKLTPDAAPSPQSQSSLPDQPNPLQTSSQPGEYPQTRRG